MRPHLLKGTSIIHSVDVVCCYPYRSDSSGTEWGYKITVTAAVATEVAVVQHAWLVDIAFQSQLMASLVAAKFVKSLITKNLEQFFPNSVISKASVLKV